MTWVRLTDFPGQLNLALTLQAGQVFCWEEQEPNVWVGVIGQNVYYLRQCDDDHVEFKCMQNKKCDQLRKFFQLDVDMISLLNEWKSTDAVFDRLVTDFAGLRICQQEPIECLISFIISANNNIKRISQNLKSIRRKYGQLLTENVHAFPTVDELSVATVEDFKEMGLGYRARYIFETVAKLKNFGLERSSDLSLMRAALIEFPGVGRKVADCVLLYSLEFHQVVPVDTHMFKIAQLLTSKTIKKDNGMHEAIQAMMSHKFGPKAGWAHCYLFAANLPTVNKKLRT